MPKALTINRDDKQFDAFPSYEELRKLGMEYIASFSGELWTDHNIHDPGINMLEILCYALTDLGYRTSLNVEDLLAPVPGDTSPENNFFTPEEILSCNPVTITDIRRMLVDIEGVRNAWVVPSEQQEIPLYFKNGDEELSLQKPVNNNLDTNSCPTQTLLLKGLYKVLLDVDPLINSQEGNCDQSNGSLSAILSTVKERLYEHRNLCEDFQEIKVLNDEEIAVCTDLELAPDANPERVLLAVYEAIENLISPRLPFHSLQELLKKGRSIQQIYQGRPYTPAYAQSEQESKFSHGFVDIEALEAADLPTALYASDFYRVIMDVPGVRAIKQLFLNNYLGGISQTNGEEWELPLTLDHRPVFSPDLSQFKFYKGVLRIPSPGTNAARERFRKRLADFQKAKYDPKALNEDIPYGRYRENLGDYYSIQHEFPTTYGIGEGDLSSDAPDERKVQALQLKGYLSFFDQLLANYCSQLANIRSLFAISKTDDADRNTYFSQLVENIPQLEKLLRFYGEQENGSTGIPLVLANSHYSFEHPAERDLALQQLINELTAFDANDIRQRIVITETEGTYTFTINDNRGQTLLKSEDKYKSETDAQQAIQSVLFMGILAGNYEKINLPTEHCYSFRLLENTDSYASFLQQIVESPESYLQRRDQILNHLLARFGEQFTDYVLLMYALNQEQQDLATVVADKERFLSNYPEISRNRGRGFNYTNEQELWDSGNNLSGMERRVSQLMGLSNWQRSTLNPFKVELRDQSCYLEIRDHRGQLLFRSANSYTDKKDAVSASEIIGYALTRPVRYRKTDCCSQSIFGFELLGEDRKVIGHFPRTFATAALRDEHLNCMLAYFGESFDLCPLITQQKNEYGFQLDSESGETLFVNLVSYATVKEAELAAKKVIQLLRKREIELDKINKPAKKIYAIHLGEYAKYPENFANALIRNNTHDYLENYLGGLLSQPAGIAIELVSQDEGWYYQLRNTDGGIYLQSSKAYDTELEACTAFKHLLSLEVNDKTYVATSGSFNGGTYSFKVVEHEEELAVHTMGYKKASTRNKLLKEVKAFVQSRGLHYEIKQDKPAFYWCADAPESSLILRNMLAFQSEDAAQEAWQQLQDTIQDKESYKLYPEGDQCKIVLRRVDGVKIAHSNLYNTKKEAKAALETWLAHWQNKQKEIPAIECREGKFYFIFYYLEQEALVGCQRFDTKEETDCAALYFGQYASSQEVYETFEEAGTCRFSFGVKQEEEWLALHPHYLPEPDVGEYISSLQENINKQYFPFALKMLAGNWHYEIRWENCRGEWETVLKENGSHPSAVGAKKAAKEMLDHYPSFFLVETGKEGDMGLNLIDIEQTLLATHPDRYTTTAELEKIKQDIRGYFDFHQALNKGEQALMTLSDVHWVCGKSNSVCSDDSDTSSTSKRWRFEICWFKPNIQEEQTNNEEPREFEILLQVATAYESKAMAETGAARLLETIAATDEWDFGNTNDLDDEGKPIYSFNLLIEEDGTQNPRIITYPGSESNEEDRNKLKNKARDFLIAFQKISQESTEFFTYTFIDILENTNNPLEDEDTFSFYEPTGSDCLLSGFRLQKDEQPVAIHPISYQDVAERDDIKERLFEMARCGEWEYTELCRSGSQLIKKVKNKYHYQWIEAIDGENNHVLWQSVKAYTTEAEAQEAFTQEWPALMQLSKNRSAYVDPSNDFPYLSLERAGEAVLFHPSALEGSDQVEPVKKDLVKFARNYPLVQQGDNYSFQLYDEEDQVIVWNATASYTSADEAWEAFQSFLSIAAYPTSYRCQDDEECNIYEFSLVETLLTSTRTYADDLSNLGNSGADNPPLVICPAEYPEPTYTVDNEAVNRTLIVSDFCDKAEADTFCPKAWDVGLEEFLIYGVNPDNYYTYLDAASCQYSFRVVTDKYQLGRFPGETHTPQEREALLDWLYNYSACAKSDYTLRYAKTDIDYTLNGKCFFKLYYNDTIHWRSYNSYRDDAAARAAVNDELYMLQLLNLAQQPDCYELIEVETPEGEEQKYQLALLDDQGMYVLISTETYTIDTYEAAMLERVQHARKYPFYEYKGKFGFQCYSTENLPDFSVTPEEDNCLSEDFVKIEAEISFASVAGTIELDIPGQVIWENIHDYDTLAEAVCAFECFEKLIKDRENYHSRRLDDCNLFGVEITHPNEVMAEHPGSYATETAVEKAIAETLACVNKEGFHLVEHILLRPKQGGSGDYSVRFKYPIYSKNDPDCLEYYEYENLTETSYSDKSTADDIKNSIWKFVKTNFEALFELEGEGVINKDDLELKLTTWLSSENIGISLSASQKENIATGLIDIHGSYNYFESVFQQPVFDNETEKYHWCIGYYDRNHCWQEQQLDYPVFDTCEEAVQAQEDLQNGLFDTLDTNENITNGLAVIDETSNYLTQTFIVDEPAPQVLDALIESLINALFNWKLKDIFFCFSRSPVEAADALMPTCPDCENTVSLSSEEPDADACKWPDLPLKPSEEDDTPAFAPGTELYVPGADPYSFWATVVLPYWPQRFQNISFRKFFEDTLRREAPAHVALRICWLDPKQMYQFDRYYRNWLEANSGQGECLLQDAKACLIDMLFNMSTVYPPARLQGGGCAGGTNEAGAILLDATQLG